MRRVPKQTLLAFGRSERVVNRQIAQRMAGKKVTPGPGRPKTGTTRMAHAKRPELGENTAVHVTMKCTRKVPNLRHRKKYALVRRAFAKVQKVAGFRLVHFAVLGDHVHMLCEADSARHLSKGIQRITISMARSLNADGVRGAGESLDPKAGPFRERRGWIGKIFADRYHEHVLSSPTEMARCLDYLFSNALKHFGMQNAVRCKITFATGAVRYMELDAFTSFADLHTAADPPMATARGYLLKRALRQKPWATRR